MNDMQRTDMLARMGLTAIMRAYDAYPQKVTITPKDIMPPVTAPSIPSDQRDKDGSRDEQAAVALALLHNMHDEGVFRGQDSLGGLSSVYLSSYFRNQLRSRNNRETLRSDEVRDALKRADEGHLPSPGAFAAFANKIGFEP